MEKGFKQNFENFIKQKDPEENFRDKSYYLDAATQHEILEIQAEKQKLIAAMHEKLALIDDGESISFEKYGKTVTQENGEYFITKKGGVKDTITRGDIAVAYKNGFDLNLDANVDRSTKKLFILHETKARISDLYNQQLIKAEVENKNRSGQDLSYKAFEALQEEESREIYENRPYGKMAETMVESFFTKFLVNNPQLPFTIESADVYDDVRKKIDFKIHLKREYVRGVKVNADESADAGSDTGIQFTLNQDATEHKEEQIARAKENMKKFGDDKFDDLVLVTVPLYDIKEKIDSWQAMGKDKSIAGPADLWDEKTQKLIFTKMLEKLPGHLAIDAEELWESTR
jgi:hypothetical protein